MTLTTTNSNNSNDDIIKRAFATHTPMWQRFSTDVSTNSASLQQQTDTSQSVYQRQYSHVYAQRLSMLKPRCLLLLKASLQEIPRIVVGRVLELSSQKENTPILVVGTLVKECENPKEEPLFPNNKCRKSDVLYLEDESGRVTLETNQVHDYPTGVVVAVKGVVKHGGILHVNKFYTPAMGPTPFVEGELKKDTNGHAPHVMLVSGLNCGAPGVCSLTRDMLLGYLQGSFDTSASKICRVVIAGNSCHANADAVKELDGWIAQVCASGIPISLLPGKDDPSTANWPQRPFHSSLLKYGGSFIDKSLLQRTPNPMACGLGDKFVVGTDGRNVSDLVQHTSIKTELEALTFTLTSGHICPTGPSSVPTVPSGEVDPMVLEETPALYFAGNCNEFATDLVEHEEKKTRVVCIPKFAKTGQVVLVNLETLDVQVLCFDDGME